MAIEIKVPVLPESVADATLAKWYKKSGDFVKRDENLVDLETDKVMLEVPAPADGILGEVLKKEGDTVLAEEVIGVLKEGEASKEPTSKEEKTEGEKSAQVTQEKEPAKETAAASPSTRRLASAQGVDVTKLEGTGKGGRILKEDVERAASGSSEVGLAGGRVEERVPMSRLRARIAERLVSVQNETAMLTTFNEVNMKAVMDMRKQYKDMFEKKHDVRLGFMSFFIKASVEALKRFPAVNASIDGNDVLYHNYFDIGVAVSTPRGLVVPVLRDVDQMNMAEIEKAILAYAEKAREGKITIEEMTGGTFTVTNGGVFGSMLSTPILNPPQSAILGMHNIVERPIAENGQVVIRPIMYLALSYDHRIVDGRESVLFLKTIKEMLEDPIRLLIEV
jgi:2-oxoglutarate dehydrogenase E2 component (dihydrolipoamide succinyltransferase)